MKTKMNLISNLKWILVTIALILVNYESKASETKLLRYPDIYKEKIVFCYVGDIYLSSTDGKNVRQLTTFPGEELLPKFLPDGAQIAFTEEFEGNKEIYVMSVHGGKPRRLHLSPGGGIRCRLES